MPFPELVFGLVGPVGINLDPVIECLERELTLCGYTAIPVKLSEQIEKFLQRSHSSKPEDERIGALMDEGSALREKSGRGDAVALLGVAEIRRKRLEELQLETEDGTRKVAFLLKSLKHPHEIHTLRNVYGKGFFVVSVYTPRDVRVDALAERIKKSNFGNALRSRAKAEGLVERDEQEANRALGQNAKDAFPLADLFIDGRDKVHYEPEIKRFIHLLFSYPFHTPSRDEHGMYHAKSAALRSSDLSRQVGAALLTSDGDLIAVGCNDVPKAGGDLYWAGDAFDARDFQIGVDATAKEREQILGEVLERLKSAGLMNAQHDQSVSELTSKLLGGELKEVLAGARILNLLEFGRSVHAEMAALASAARLGLPVKGSVMFSTTFPCHICARHIVAAGVARVVYIEPYPKSKAKDLHGDAICVDSAKRTTDLVSFEPFVGIAPRQYLEIFDAKDGRKDKNGAVIDWEAAEKKPRFSRFMSTYRDIEDKIVADVLPQLAQAVGIKYI